MKKFQASSARTQSHLTSTSVADIFAAFDPVSSETTASNRAVDALVLNCLKLLDKKDQTSRFRALNDLGTLLLPGKSRPELLAIFPHFIHAFKRGAILDPDWKCRVQYFSVLRSFCESLGKSLERDLIEFIPICVVGISDLSHRDVSMSAGKVLDTLFPEKEKKARVLTHFYDATVEFIGSSLDSTPDTLSRQFKLSEGVDASSFESLDRFERVVSACIRSLEYLLSNVANPSISSVVDLRPFRFLTHVSGENPAQIIAASIHLALVALERFPDIVTSSDAELIGSCLVRLLTPDNKEGWLLTSALRKRNVMLPTKSLNSLVSQTEVRSLTIDMLESLRGLLDPIKAIAKLKEGLGLDPRIRCKYYQVLKKLIDLISVNEEVLVVCRSDKALRLHALHHASSNHADLRPEKIGIGAWSLLTGRTDGLIQSDDVSEILFYVENVKNLSKEFLNDFKNRIPLIGSLECVIAVLNHLHCKDQIAPIVSVARQHLGFPQFTHLMLEGRVRGADWVAQVSASGTADLPAVGKVVEDPYYEDALVQAIQFDRDIVSDGVVDNGIIVIGSDAYTSLLMDLVERCTGHRIISAAVLRRAETGIGAFINDEVASKFFASKMTISNPVVDLFSSNPNLRRRCCDIVLALDEPEVDSELFPRLACENSDIEYLLSRATRANMLPVLSLIEDSQVLVSTELHQFLSTIGLDHLQDARVTKILDRIRLLPLMAYCDAIRRMLYSEKEFLLYKLLMGISCDRKHVDDSDEAEHLVSECLNLDSEWSWCVLRFLVENLHLSLPFTNDLVDRIGTDSSSSLDVFKCAVAVSLDASFLVTSDPTVPKSTRAHEEAFAITALARNRPIQQIQSLRFVDVAKVAELLIQTQNTVICENACSRYFMESDSSIDSIDPHMIEFLEANGSVTWALMCLDSDKLIHSGIKCLGKLDLVDLFRDDRIFSRMKTNQPRTTDVMAQVVQLRLWQLALSKFMSIKDDSFCFLLEFIEEALVVNGDTDDATNVDDVVKREFVEVGLTVFDIIQRAERYAQNDLVAQYLYRDALEFLELYLQAAPPGDIHEWASTNTSLVSERTVVEHGISGNLIEKQVATNKYRNESLRSNFSLSSKLLVCNYSSHGGEIQAELSVRFPECWPLRLGQVEVSPVLGLSKQKNARLKISIQSVFRMNGVQNAIQIWIENIEGFLKDVEECYICYSVTYHHGTGKTNVGSIPNKRCRTCKNAFHSECLLKYFRTSGKTICCLCQNPF